MLHNLKRWFETHFGGKQDLQSINKYTAKGNLWFGSNPKLVVVSYKGKTWGWDKDGLMSGGDYMDYTDMVAGLIGFILANENKENLMGLLYVMTEQDFNHVQRKGNIVQDGFLSEESITQVKQRLGEIK
jgi:hypothetical protein